MLQEEKFEDVKEYYGKVLNTNKDLKTSACCLAESLPQHLKTIIKDIHPEVVEKFYGCGSPIPDEIQGLTALDLGSGSGRDCYVLSKLVGESGKVIGVDMTDEQLQVAQKHKEFHREAFGHSISNVEFHKGYIENLEELGIENESVDLVVSNCVLNLSPSKSRVFREIFRVLKTGGELYFSDVFADRRIPQQLVEDPLLRGECLSGAMYIEDFRRLMTQVGCLDYRIVANSPLELHDPEVKQKIGMVNFYSMTIRAFKLPLEDRCEDYGQVAYYKGSIPYSPHNFCLDDHHNFQTGHPLPVCSNTASMIKNTRFAKHFEVIGDTSVHFGLFDCDTPTNTNINATDNPGACC